jgi:cobalt-precorrin 5A hydrolase/precorrin-3B C17-methyltransferase
MMPVIVVLTAGGLALARRIAPALGAPVHGLRARVPDADVTFDDTTAALRALHAGGHAIVGICAAGILVRALAPVLAGKRDDAPVVAVAEDGSVAVPLLSGHRGANTLARRIAAVTGGVAAITTAGDVALGVALDAPPPGWRIADVAAAKPVAAALLAGEPVALAVDAELAGIADWLAPLKLVGEAARTIRVTSRAAASDALTYHPPVLALGVGGERGVAAEELAQLADDTLAAHGLSPLAIACVASIDLKADEDAVHALAARLGVPARFFDATTLAAEAPRLATPSEVVLRATGCPGVAEGAALAAAGPRATLVAPKRKSARATCALALSPVAIDPLAVGHARGTLAIVGIGPGDAAWRTPEVTHALADAEEVVGYGIYLDLVADLIAGKVRHEGTLGAEEARAALALDRAAAGKRVALVSSGDAGIYGLATLVFELLDRPASPAGGRAHWRRVALRVCPGVSALQAAAARAGAPLGHDFCAISLSDLLTPWAAIERRLSAAAAADFVIALYNPASQRRTEQIQRALAIIAAARPATTPVVIARNLGRAGERVAITTLADAAKAEIDMLTIVVVGSSATRRLAGRDAIYTPRGYGEKS